MEIGLQGHARRIMWITLTTLTTFQTDKSNFLSSHQKRKDLGRKERIQSAREKKLSIPCKNHAAGLGNAASNTADEEARGSNVFHGSKCTQSPNSSIFPHKKDHVNVGDNENDDESGFSDPVLCPIEDIEDHEFASPQDFFPLASQCSPLFAISNRPPVQYGKGHPLSSHWKTCFKGTGSTLLHEVRASKSPSFIRPNEIDPNLISKKTASFNRKSSTTISYQSGSR